VADYLRALHPAQRLDPRRAGPRLPQYIRAGESVTDPARLLGNVEHLCIFDGAVLKRTGRMMNVLPPAFAGLQDAGDLRRVSPETLRVVHDPVKRGEGKSQ